MNGDRPARSARGRIAPVLSVHAEAARGYSPEAEDQFPCEAVTGFYEQLAAGWRDDILPALKRAAER